MLFPATAAKGFMTARTPSFLCSLAVCVLVLFVSGGVAARAADRLALVIGNAHYSSAPALSNPTNDAEDLASSLRSLGFEVIERSDATRAAMADAVREFSEKLEGVDTALFFYAGHGVQVNGDNYLVPVDAKIDSPSDVRFGTINLNDIMGEMEGKGHAAIILLDACRDNPFADAVAKSGRSLGGRGLGRIDPNGAGMLVVYSTQPNNIALDGGGRNSPFTSALLAHVRKPGVEVRQLVSEVRADVLSSTDGKQVPWDNSSLVGNVYLMASPPAYWSSRRLPRCLRCLSAVCGCRRRPSCCSGNLSSRTDSKDDVRGLSAPVR